MVGSYVRKSWTTAAPTAARITVVSTVGQGSSFTLWLPADVSNATDAPAEHTTISMSADDAERGARPVPQAPQQLHGLREAAHGVVSQLDSLVDRVVARIRADHAVTMAAGMPQSLTLPWALTPGVRMVTLVGSSMQ